MNLKSDVAYVNINCPIYETDSLPIRQFTQLLFNQFVITTLSHSATRITTTTPSLLEDFKTNPSKQSSHPLAQPIPITPSLKNQSHNVPGIKVHSVECRQHNGSNASKHKTIVQTAPQRTPPPHAYVDVVSSWGQLPYNP